MEKVRSRYPTLTIKGFVIRCAGQASGSLEHRFDWENALIDAVIVSGVTFFGSLGGGAIAGISGQSGIEAATIAALAQFFVFLALKRGIVQSKET